MPTKPVFMLKAFGETIVNNRTIKIVSDNEESPFRVLVTDRDVEYDSTGHALTLVFDQSFESIADANAEVEIQVNLSLADGFILNRMSMI